MKQILFVIDMLNDFIRPEGALFCGPTAVEIINPVVELVQSFRKKGDTVFFICDAHKPDDKEFNRFPKHCVAGTWGALVIDEVKYDPTKSFHNPDDRDYMIPKRRYNAFYDTILHELLYGMDVYPDNTEVTVCGVCTSICVMDTVGWLANKDFNIVVPRNCVADFDQKWHELALERMEKLYGAVII